MALITCSECSTEISDKAAACPKCGAPQRGTVTTQQTAKRYKGAQLIGVLLICIGVVWLIVAAQSRSAGGAPSSLGGPVLLFLAGMIIYIAARIRAWWSHG